MDGRLLEAALSGNTKALLELCQRDRNILANVTLTSAETPLHIAALYGHVDFTAALLPLWPAFARELNQDGFSPMHMASANGHLGIVTKLLEFGQSHSIVQELCMQKSMNGKTPLHCAVIKGRVEVIDALLNACPESARELTDQGETVLHLAVKNNQRKGFQFLIQKPSITELVNLMDQEGNTILHLATAHKQHQTVKFLLSLPNINVNVANSKGLTCLDVLLMVPSLSNNIGIGEMLRAARGEESQNLQLSVTQRQTPKSITEGILGNGSDNNVSNHVDEEKEMRSGIMTMATLIATVTFQAAMTPPGGFWQDGANNNNNNSSVSNITTASPSTTHKVGSAIIYDLAPKEFTTFLLCDTVCFLTSLTIILIMIPRILNRNSAFWIMMRAQIYVIVLFAQLVFLEAITLTTDIGVYDREILAIFPLFWIFYGIMILYNIRLFLFQTKKSSSE